MSVHLIPGEQVPKDAQLIDVREPLEFAQVHARGARNIPMNELPGAIDQLDQSRDIYLICHLGGRSARCAEYLEQAMPEATLYDVAGGTDAWVSAGLPTD